MGILDLWIVGVHSDFMSIEIRNCWEWLLANFAYQFGSYDR
jgi:hypothetical protein